MQNVPPSQSPTMPRQRWRPPPPVTRPNLFKTVLRAVRETHWLTRAVALVLSAAAVALNLCLFYSGVAAGSSYPNGSITTFAYYKPALYGFPFAHYTTGIYNLMPDDCSAFFGTWVYHGPGTFLPYNFLLNVAILALFIVGCAVVIELLVRKRLRLQFHLSTAIAIMFLAGFLIALNADPRGLFLQGADYRKQAAAAAYPDDFQYAADGRARMAQDFINSCEVKGWPYSAIVSRDDAAGKCRVFTINAMLALLVAASAAGLLEWRLRKRAVIAAPAAPAAPATLSAAGAPTA